ncbi:MAG: M20 metallopeptidase family protein [Emergencia timonensis]
MKEIHKLAMENSSEVIELRRDIHKHPEIGRKEFRTADLIRSKLEEYGVDQIDSPVPTAVIALIHGNKGEGKCVALRADIDALPVEEETGLPYSSEVPGMMHACGHDMHVAMLLGVAKILCQKREEFAGTVKLIFQHSEDTMPGGAKELVEKGAENPQVDAIFRCVYPDEDKVGKISILGLDYVCGHLQHNRKGKGGHGSEPHTTKSI